MGLFIRAVTDDGGPTRPLSERGDKEGDWTGFTCASCRRGWSHVKVFFFFLLLLKLMFKALLRA